MFYRLKINKNIDYTYSLCQTHLRYKSNKRINRFNFKTYDKKLENNISRAKTNVFNIVFNNKFDFFFTQTIDSVYCRQDLDLLIDKFRNCNKELKRIYNDNFYYLIIPEYHQDKHNWHLHGFLSSAYSKDSYINKNGFLSLSIFDKIGFNSISAIKNYSACSKYILKYITKDTANILKKGQHFYYCSKKLKRSNIVNQGTITQIAPIHFDFKSDFAFKTNINQKQYYKLITDLDNIQGITYIEDSTKNVSFV